MNEERDVRGLLGRLPEERRPHREFAASLRAELAAAAAPSDARLSTTEPVTEAPRRRFRSWQGTMVAAVLALVVAIGLASVLSDDGPGRVATLPPSAAARATSACDAFRARAFGGISESELLGAGAATTVARPDAARIYSGLAETFDALSRDLRAVRADRLGAGRALDAVRGLASETARWIGRDRPDAALLAVEKIEPGLVALDRSLIRSGIGACR